MSENRVFGATFEDHLAALNLRAARTGYVLATTLIPTGVLLEFVVYPDYIEDFFWIRVIASAISLALLVSTYYPPLERLLPDFLPPLVAAASIESMVLWLGDLTSPYYAGLNLCTLAMGVLYTWRWYRALAVSGAIVAMWAIPALSELALGTLDLRLATNNMYFLTLTSAIAVSSNELRYQLTLREFKAITAVAQTSAELADALEKAREVDRLKSQFFANISHELRTPLTLILSPVEELISTYGPGVERNSLEVVRRNASRLLQMIDDLLDLARLEAGGLRLKVRQIDLHTLAERVSENARPAAKAKGLKLGFRVSGDPIEIFGDPHRIEIILTNLIGNAMKFTPPGGGSRSSVFHKMRGHRSR